MKTKHFIAIFVLAIITITLVYTNLREINNKQFEIEKFPYLDYYQLRSFPDKYFDYKAYKTALSEEKVRLLNKAKSGNETNWLLEGPKNIGGRINVVIADPDDSNIIYAGLTNGGIFKTIDGGHIWFPIFDDNAYLSISALVFEPGNSEIIYAGTGDHNISGYPFIGNGIYKSEDAGNTWLYLGLAEQSIVSRIIIHPDSIDIIYAATMGVPFIRNNQRGLYKSVDGGESWEQVLFIADDAGVIDLVMNPENPQILYATGWNRVRNLFESVIWGSAAKIYKTVDGGANWEILNGGLPQENGTRIGLCMSNQNPDKIYALYLDNTFQIDNIYKTENAGADWTTIPISGLDNTMGGFGWYFGQIRVNPANDDELYVLGVNMMKTTNGGQSWSYSPESNYYDQHVDKHDLHFIDENTMISATDGGLYYSTDRGASWVDMENIPNTQFYRITYDPHNPGFYAGGAQDNGTIYGNVETINNWDHRLGGDGFQVLFDYENENIGYAMTQNGSIYYHASGNWDNWDDFTNGLDDSDRRSWDMPLIMSKVNSDVLYTGTYKIYKVENAPNGIWQTISNDLTNGTDSRYHVISAIEESSINTNHIYAGTTDGKVWRTPDGGSNWENISTGLPVRFVSAIKASQISESIIFVSHTGYKLNDFIPHVHVSNDNGNNWIDISGNLPQLAVNDIFVLDNHGDSVIFAATDGGVYFTLNRGNEWERLGNDMPLIPVYDIDYDPINKKLLAGTHARSMLSFPVDSIFDTGIPDKTRYLIQENIKVYPNPVKTELNLELPFIDGQNLEIYLYNQAGAIVKVINLEYNQTEVNIPLQNTESGIYTIVIKSKEDIYCKKIIKL